jgi:hypothetical protein
MTLFTAINFIITKITYKRSFLLTARNDRLTSLIHNSRSVTNNIDLTISCLTCCCITSIHQALTQSLLKSCPTKCHESAWGKRRYRSYSFLTLALDRGERSASRPGRALPRGKDPRYPLYRGVGGPQSRSGHRG